MRFLILILLAFSSWSSSSFSFGQMLLNHKGEQTDASWQFNKEFVRAQRIKTLKGTYSYKKPGKPMYSTSSAHSYEFDSLGNVTTSYETRKDDGTRDTVRRRFFYNDRGWKIYESMEFGENFSYSTTVYNDSQWITSFENFVRIRDGMGISQIVLEDKQSFSYFSTDSNLIKQISNRHGTPYMYEGLFCNEKNKVVRRELRFLTTNQGTIFTYRYNAKGELVLYREATSKQDLELKRVEFKYDEKGNILEKKIFLEGLESTENQFIYNDESGILSAIILQENEDGNLTILRFQEISFYE